MKWQRRKAISYYKAYFNLWHAVGKIGSFHNAELFPSLAGYLFLYNAL